MIDAELFRAKVEVIAAFASGPGVMIDDDEARDERVASLIALVEIEYGLTPERQRGATITTIHPNEIHASNTQINWPELIAELRLHRGVSKTLLYDKMHTAVVTASRTRQNYPDVTTMTEKRGVAGALILTVD